MWNLDDDQTAIKAPTTTAPKATAADFHPTTVKTGAAPECEAVGDAAVETMRRRVRLSVGPVGVTIGPVPVAVVLPVTVAVPVRETALDEPLVVEALKIELGRHGASYVERYLLPLVINTANSSSKVGDLLDLAVALALCEKKDTPYTDFLNKFNRGTIAPTKIPVWLTGNFMIDKIVGTAHREHLRHFVRASQHDITLQAFIQRASKGEYLLPKTTDGADGCVVDDHVIIVVGNKFSADGNVPTSEVHQNFESTNIATKLLPKLLQGIIRIHVVLPTAATMKTTTRKTTDHKQFCAGLYVKQITVGHNIVLDEITLNIEAHNLANIFSSRLARAFSERSHPPK